ncbi:M28 family peptidase [Rheinheimera sediminis]|uniref:M28 family peptidase n=1 Tax=Rheinheimera sp. YQF-1 TaxID=2499626 RepID=UPI000FD7C45A|nr:M28 family peptidase [Rheinheimera sp. YQF-1]RVT46087.1 M28 family peptidase [Rheinheimera sp. YQF-1]
MPSAVLTLNPAKHLTLLVTGLIKRLFAVIEFCALKLQSNLTVLRFLVFFLLSAILPFGLQAHPGLLHDIQQLSDHQMSGRKTGTFGAQLARSYIQQRFTDLGLTALAADYQHPFSYSRGFSEQQGINLIAELKGCVQPDAYIVLTAHYDHLGVIGGKTYYGADDNASGVATMLALAELLKNQSCPQYSYLFVATDAEELGLYGAKAFVSSPPVALQQMLLNINLDMLSRGERANHLYLYGAFSLPGMADFVKSREFAVKLKVRKRGKGLTGQQQLDWANASDHAPFRRAGIPFLFFGVDSHKDYHTPQDSWQKINPAYLQRMFHSLSQIVLWLDQQPPAWYQAARKTK